jgi:putative phosphoribosyl transferase
VVVADSGESGRRHPWDRLAAALNQAGLGTLVVGLLMPQEILSYGKRSNVQALAGRLTGATRWLIRHPAVCGLPVGYCGASAAAAALWAAAAGPRVPVAAIVCQDGRPDPPWPGRS